MRSPSDEIKRVDQAWDAVSAHLNKAGFRKQSKLRCAKALGKDIDQLVVASRYQLNMVIVLDIGLAVQCNPLEAIFRAKVPNLDKNFFTSVTSLVHLLNHYGKDRVNEDYGVADPDRAAELICRDFDDYAGRFFDAQTDMAGALNYLESEPHIAGSTIRRASIVGLQFLTGQRDKARQAAEQPSFGANNVFEKAIQDHIEEAN